MQALQRVYKAVRHSWHLKFEIFCSTVLLHSHISGSQTSRLTSSNIGATLKDPGLQKIK